jgi:hypothetical protein
VSVSAEVDGLKVQGDKMPTSSNRGQGGAWAWYGGVASFVAVSYNAADHVHLPWPWPG